MKKIIIEKEPLIYFLFNKNKIVYIGETAVEKGKRIHQHKKDKIYNSYAEISGKKRPFINNIYFRKYYELRLINKFKPKYNKEKTTAPSLNNFICKMFLWNENPNPNFINPFTAYNQIKYNKYFEYRTKQRKIKKVLNQYTNVWNNLDMNKKLYIDNQNAFTFLINETMKPSNNYSTKFIPREERLHN